MKIAVGDYVKVVRGPGLGAKGQVLWIKESPGFSGEVAGIKTPSGGEWWFMLRDLKRMTKRTA